MLRLAPLALVVGVVDGLVFLGFEWIVKNGTDWLWNDLAGTDHARWRVVPLAVALSVALSALLRVVRQPRWVPPHLDPLSEDEDSPPPALPALALILLVGAASLLAGASLGPEAPLVAVAIGLGAWAAARGGLGGHGRLLALASAGALLVAFFGSLIPLAIPLLVLLKRNRRPPAAAVVAIVVAGLAAWGTLWLVQGDPEGFGEIRSDTVHARDYAAAFVLGTVAAGAGTLLHWVLGRLSVVCERLHAGTPWWLAGAIFGAVLGVLYLIGGRSVEFNGSEGSALLLSGELRYGAAALAGLALVKIVATGWSLSAGYRGGLVFPSVYVGVAVSLSFAAALPDLAGPGVLVGSVAGLLVVMTALVPGVVMLLALLPAKLLGVGLAGAAGAVAGRAAIHRLGRGILE